MNNSCYLDTALSNIRKGIDINHNLLEYIQNFMQEVKENPNCQKTLCLGFAFDDDNMIELGVDNNSEGDIFDEPGVCLVILREIYTKEQFNHFKRSDLYRWFLEPDEEVCLYMNFGFDAESLCIAIQYLAQWYGCPSDKITIEIQSTNVDISEDSDSRLIPSFFVAIIILLVLIAILFIYFAVELEEPKYYFASIACVGCIVYVIRYFKNMKE